MNIYIPIRVVQNLEKEKAIKEEVDVIKDGKPTGEKIEQDRIIKVPYTVSRLAFAKTEEIDMWFESGEKLERTAVEINGDSILLDEPQKDFMSKFKAADPKRFSEFKETVILEAVPKKKDPEDDNSEIETQDAPRKGYVLPEKIGMFIEEGKNQSKAIAMYAGRPLKLGVKVESIVNILKTKGIKVG